MAEAPDKPFAIGRFELYEDAIPGRSMLPTPPAAAPRIARRTPDEPLPKLALCRSCNQYIWPDEEVCPHCDAEVANAAQKYAAEELRRRALMAELEGVLLQLGAIAANNT